MQLRLFTLVAMVMLVLWLMDQARRPESWYWMWGGNPDFSVGPPLTDEELEGGSRDIDTRLQARTDDELPPGVIVAPREPSILEGGDTAFDSDIPKSDAAKPDDARLERTRAHGWSRVIARLSADQDEGLRSVLKAARDEQPPSEETAQHWPAVLEQLEKSWDEYLQEAFQYLVDAREQLSEPQRATWHTTVQKLEIEWRQTIHPALKAAGSGESLTSEDRLALAGLQETLDHVALGAVRDNSVFRSAERHAWFRLLEKLDQQALEDLEKESSGRVGFIQLFDQSSEYRGKLVTVRGTAHMAYRVRAPKNIYGIAHYYVFWIAPAGGPDSPICVYALETPPGFPELKDKDEDRATTSLNIDVEFTGYFFKRWAYRAQDGLRVAPLVLGKVPRWTPPPPTFVASPSMRPLTMAMYLLGAAAIAITISLIAYWQGQWRSARKRNFETSAERDRKQLKALEENDPAEDIRETLRRLSKESQT